MLRCSDLIREANLGPIDDDDPGTVGFTANEVVDAASVATTGETEITDEVPDPLSVALTLRFTITGEVDVVDFGLPSDVSCPTGTALRLPVVFDLDGTIGDWSVSDADEDLALIATAASLDAVSSDNPGDAADAWQATVDPALEAAARNTLPSYVSSSCAMTFSIGPRPFDLTVGAWNDEIMSRDYLDVDCDNYTASFVRWTTDSVAPLE